MASVILVAIAMAIASPAAAGGSWLEFERAVYFPGEEAVAVGSVSRGQLGWVEDGPFFAYLSDQAGYLQTGDVYLGELEFEVSRDWLRTSLRFTVPDLEAGHYAFVYCNDPCTDGVGDLIGGEFVVGQPLPQPNPRAAGRWCASLL